MFRIVLINIFLFLLPFLLYGLYAWLMRRGDQQGGSVLDDAPITWLLIIGCVIVIGSVGYFISFSGAPPGGKYVAPVYKDGKIQPGHVE